MKKTFAILAVMVFGLGMISCEAETSIEETEALFDVEQNATDGDESNSGERGEND